MGRTTKENPLCNENMNQTRCSLLNRKFLGEYIKPKKSFPKEITPLQSLPLKELEEEVPAALTVRRNYEELGRYALLLSFGANKEHSYSKESEIHKNKF